jgi:hypothetical protein
MKRLSLCAILLASTVPLLGQEVMTPKATAPRHFYKLNYVLKEFDEGKVVNQRDFVVTVSTGDRYSSRLRAGSRFPVRDEGKTNYVDVGVNLDNRLEDLPDGLAMDVNAEISSPANDPANTGGAPVIRQVRTNAQAVVPLNKPFVLFNVDEPSSRHRFELDVTAVPQK